MIHLIYKYKFTIIIATVVLSLSLMSSSEMPTTKLWNFKGIDKLVHLAMYSALSLVLFFEKYRSVKNFNRQPFHTDNIYPIVVIIIAGGIIELIQPVLANRSRELMDFFANGVGVFLGFYLHVWFKKYYNARKFVD